MDEREKLLSELGHRIMRERKKKGITLEKLAYEMGISKGNLSDIENGKRDPRYTTLLAIADGLAIPMDRILRQK